MHVPEMVELTNMCMVEDARGRVLVQDRVDPTWPGITFPGGHVEPGESFVDAVIREVREETGLTIAHPRLCGVKHWIRKNGVRYVVLLYRTKFWEGELHASSEGEVRWVPLEELSFLPLAHGMDRMLRVFLEENLSEQWFVREDGQTTWQDILQ